MFSDRMRVYPLSVRAVSNIRGTLKNVSVTAANSGKKQKQLPTENFWKYSTTHLGAAEIAQK